jgi:DNA-binding PadR family transcriptional regulator
MNGDIYSSTKEGTTLYGESRILRVLKDKYPNGLGILELKRRTSEKCVRLWLPKLYERGCIEYKNPDAKRGEKKIVVITEEGLKDETLWREIRDIEEEFLKKYDVHSNENNVDMLRFEKKLDLYEKVLMDIFDVCLRTDSKFALRFLNTTLFVVRKVLDKKQYDLETRIIVHKTIQNALLKSSLK